MTTANRTGFKPLLRLWAYRRGVAAFIANRTRLPFIQCQDVVEWNWHILIDAYDEGARFQEAGQRILHSGARAGPAIRSLNFQVDRESLLRARAA
ncbi:MAG: hypothetical protein IID48_12710, partial [Proteobacteria bacterium]|nr:hypothetical protein [Pseudomonadota bacterium]